MVEIPESPSIFLAEMAGSKLPIVVSHGEGRAEFVGDLTKAKARVAMRYIDNYGKVATTYPFNPNGWRQGPRIYCSCWFIFKA